MGHKFVPWARRVDGISRNERYLLMIMTDAAFNDTRELKISLDGLAELAYYSPKSRGAVWKLLNGLVEKGLIKKRGHADGAGNQTKNSYFIQWENWWESSAEEPDNTVSQERPPAAAAQGTVSPEKHDRLSGETAPSLMKNTTVSQERNVTRSYQDLPGSNPRASARDGNEDPLTRFMEVYPGKHKAQYKDASGPLAAAVKVHGLDTILDGAEAYSKHETATNKGGQYRKNPKEFIEKEMFLDWTMKPDDWGGKVPAKVPDGDPSRDPNLRTMQALRRQRGECIVSGDLDGQNEFTKKMDEEGKRLTELGYEYHQGAGIWHKPNREPNLHQEWMKYV